LRLAEPLVRYFGYPLWLVYKGELGIVTWQRRFQPLWAADRERLQELRLPALAAMLVHAASTTKYYLELFRKLGFDPRSLQSESDIKQLPFLTKEQLNQDLNSFLSNAYRREQLVCSSTGGSSGLSLTFYRDRQVQAIRRAQDYLFNAHIGVFPGQRRAWVWGARMDAFSMRSPKALIANALTERAIYFYAFDASDEKMDDFLKELKRHKPMTIFAYPNMLAALAQRAQKIEMTMPPIRNVIVTAEPLHKWQRPLFREIFGAETFERYGAREIGTVASECNQHTGMHLFEPSYHLEVVDDEGRDVPYGQMGELVVTDLYNRGMPFIRYRTGDMVVMDDGYCSCGCTWRRIVGIGGRIVDMIARPDGSRVEGLVIVNALHTSGFRLRVQVVQTTPISLIVRHLASDRIPEPARDAFARRIRETLGDTVSVTYEPVEQLHYDPSGKYRYVTSECR
jgi:phenylacetate-CoA ligase